MTATALPIIRYDDEGVDAIVSFVGAGGITRLNPDSEFGADILGGMMFAQNTLGQISWTGLARPLAKGHVIATGARVVVVESTPGMEQAAAEWVLGK